MATDKPKSAAQRAIARWSYRQATSPREQFSNGAKVVVGAIQAHCYLLGSRRKQSWYVSDSVWIDTDRSFDLGRFAFYLGATHIKD